MLLVRGPHFENHWWPGRQAGRGVSEKELALVSHQSGAWTAYALSIG